MTSRKDLPRNKEFWIALVTVVGIALHLAFRFGALHHAQDWPLFVVLAVGGTPLVWDLLMQVFRREFGADLLAGISIITSVALGEYLAGAIVVLMLSGGETLEHYAMGRAASVLEALAKRMPSIAHRRVDGETHDIEVSEIVVGDELMILPSEICPVDGEVIEGHGTMDESYLTGEPYKISKAPGSDVLSGAINGESAISIRATKLPQHSRYAQIMSVMDEAQQTRPKIRRLADRLGALYTPLALVIASLAWVVSGDPVRFLAVLVVATPCPLLIAIPVALVGAISLAAKRAIVIRDTTVLEQVDNVEVIILDKTGTLTLGEPSLTDVVTGPGFEDDQVIRLAASAENFSKHPLASAIITAARERGLDLKPVSELSERPGEGMSAQVDDRLVHITSRNKLIDRNHAASNALPDLQSGLECVVLIDDAYAATFRFHDAPRAEGRDFIAHLRPKHALRKVMLVSGDRQSEVNYLAEEVGITEVFAEQNPEDKVDIVRRETESACTMFVGDGVNDAPALMTATVGVAMGKAHEVTAEAAGAVILQPSLGKVDELFHIGRRFRRVALQSALGGMGLSVIGMGFAAFGFLPPVAGAIAQEVIDLISIVNSLRVAFGKHELTDYEEG